MRGPEAKFYDLLMDKGGDPRRIHLPGDISRVENIADSGTPDLSGAWNGFDYWVELKALDKDHLAPVEKLLRPAQVVWGIRRSNQGTRIFVLARILDRMILLKTLRHGKYVPVAVFKKERNKWPWPSFETTFQYAITHYFEITGVK
jgi:hypothetical protein